MRRSFSPQSFGYIVLSSGNATPTIAFPDIPLPHMTCAMVGVDVVAAQLGRAMVSVLRCERHLPAQINRVSEEFASPSLDAGVVSMKQVQYMKQKYTLNS